MHMIGGLRVWQVQANPMSVRRTERHIAESGTDNYLLAMHVVGAARATQDGKSVVLGPGDVTVFDGARPYTVDFAGPGRFEHLIFEVPRQRVTAQLNGLDLATMVRVAATGEAGRLLAPYLRTVAASDWSPTQEAATRYVDTGIDLLSHALGADSGALSAVKAYVLAHVNDPELTPSMAARACHMSVRQLHRLFEPGGVSFATWLREERLARCCRALADARLSALSVATVARRYGFTHPEHFTRCFTARYGLGPREFRRRALSDTPKTFE